MGAFVVPTQEKIRITGDSFIEIKLNAVGKLALHTKQLVLPVQLNEDLPFQLFPSTSVVQMTASRILDTLADPSSSAAIALAREHLAKLVQERTLHSVGNHSRVLVYCEYVLTNPATKAAEKFIQSRTGFIVTADRKFLTAKRPIEPWKLDPQIVFLIQREQLELDPASYRLAVRPAGAQVLTSDGQLNFPAAMTMEKQTLHLVKAAPDQMVTENYQDADSCEKPPIVTPERKVFALAGGSEECTPSEKVCALIP